MLWSPQGTFTAGSLAGLDAGDDAGCGLGAAPAQAGDRPRRDINKLRRRQGFMSTPSGFDYLLLACFLSSSARLFASAWASSCSSADLGRASASSRSRVIRCAACQGVSWVVPARQVRSLRRVSDALEKGHTLARG